MTRQTRLKHHADLVDRMAETLGVDLEQAMIEGRMRMDQLGDAVLACTGCTQPDTCARWLATQTTDADVAPDYCRNTEMLARLRRGLRA